MIDWKAGVVAQPGQEVEHYQVAFYEDLNGASIYRGNGVEGHWFRASEAWQRFVEPILHVR